MNAKQMSLVSPDSLQLPSPPPDISLSPLPKSSSLPSPTSSYQLPPCLSLPPPPFSFTLQLLCMLLSLLLPASFPSPTCPRLTFRKMKPFVILSAQVPIYYILCPQQCIHHSVNKSTLTLKKKSPGGGTRIKMS